MKELIDFLIEKEITVAEGLSDEEITIIENKYDIAFPKSLKDFYKEGLPISEGFVNWRDSSENNVKNIKNLISSTFSDIEENADEIYWNDEWGDEPNDTDAMAEVIKEKIKSAPKLIPIYSHRYMPMSLSDNPPIISVHDIDVIYYGKDLEDYFKIEFGDKKQSDIDFETIQKIPFWTEIM